MNEYPPYPGPASPYMPPGIPFGYVDPAEHLLDPARRAGLFMILLGVLGLLFGACFVGVGAGFSRIDWPPETAAELSRLETQAGVAMPTILLVMGVLVALPAVALLVVGLFVRRGGLASAIVGIVLTSMILILLALQLVGSLLGGLAALGGVVMLGILMGLFILLLSWLVGATRAAVAIRAVRAGARQQLWSPHPTQTRYGFPSGWPPPPPPSNWPMQPPPPPPV